MAKDPPLPFEVGQLVEAKFFILGYRGSWFRCKIKKIIWKKHRVGHVLHYVDFPDEREEWIESYQLPPIGNRKRKEPLIDGKKGIERERQLMLRPPYPPIYHSDQSISTGEISEAIVITKGTWQVGSLVDWKKDGCYWSGKVTQLLGNEKAMVELMPPPLGEGGSYEVSFRDVRPSLDWSLEDGWTVPTSKDVGDFHQCARITYPLTQAIGSKSVLEEAAHIERMIDHQVAFGLPSTLSSGSDVAVGSSDEKKMQMESPQEMQIETSKEKISAPGTSIKLLPEDSSNSPKKFRTCTEIPLNSTKVDTLEAAIIDLEELANKLTWLKEISKFGIPLSDVVRPSWKFVEHRGSSTRK